MNETKSFFKTRLRGRGQITLPPEIRARLNIHEGDDVVFYINENGQVVITQAQMIDPAQAWFWTERWQKAEMESRQDYLNGNFVEFENADDAIKYMNEYANAKNKNK